MNTLLSVCIPTFNRVQQLKKCLSSVLPQAKLLGITVYVCDNHSNDGTMELLTQLQTLYTTSLVVKTQPQTVDLDVNMLQVLQMCSSRYALWLGDDDILAEHTLQSILAALKDNPDLCILGVPQHPLHQKYIHADQFFHDYGMIGLGTSMQFSTLVVDTQAILKLPNPLRYRGTLHLYAGVILDYLAEKEKQNGCISVPVLPVGFVQLSTEEKSWKPLITNIFFRLIPHWISLLPKYYHKQSLSKQRMEDFYQYINQPKTFWTLMNLRETPLFQWPWRLLISPIRGGGEPLQIPILSLV